MLLIIAIIIGLTLAVMLFTKITGFEVCPICAAVVLTWAGMLGLMLLGYNLDKTILTILISMSVGATATRYKLGLPWKIGIVVLGLPLVYYIINGNLVYSAILATAIILMTLFFGFRIKPKGENQHSKEDRFKDCC